jgi:hypothetical protein
MRSAAERSGIHDCHDDPDADSSPKARHRQLHPWANRVGLSGELHRLAMERLPKADRRKPTLADRVNVCVMESKRSRDALALDRQFAEQGRRILPRSAA